jgi:hypothetical protein
LEVRYKRSSGQESHHTVAEDEKHHGSIVSQSQNQMPEINSPDPNYPAMYYHRSGKEHKVYSADQVPAGDDWATQPWPPIPEPAPDDTIESLTAKFDIAYAKLVDENAKLRAELEKLKAKKAKA